MAQGDLIDGLQESTRDITTEGVPFVGAPAPEAPAQHIMRCTRRRVLRRHVKILFFSANTRAAQQLALDEEYRMIEERLEASKFRDAFKLVAKLAVRVEDLQRALLKHRPDVVHFACHGNEDAELVLLTKEGAPARVSAETLASYFGILRDNVVLVVLNACFASKQASAIQDSISMTIGMRERLTDVAAITFSGALYEGLAHGRTVRESFELATTAISACRSQQGRLPELFESDGIDASVTCLIGERPPWLAHLDRGDRGTICTGHLCFTAALFS